MFHALFLLSNGTVYATGQNTDGWLGLGDLTDRTTPEALTSLGSDNIAISAGAWHSIFLKANHSVWVAGRGRDYQLGVDTRTACGLHSGLRCHTPVPVLGSDTDRGNMPSLGFDNVQIFAGEDFSIILKENGAVW